MLEQIITERLGPPILQLIEGVTKLEWGRGPANGGCELIVCASGRSTGPECASELAVLEPIYGRTCGGFIRGAFAKVASLGATHWGLYDVAELQHVDVVQHARQSYPQAVFFLDAANIWYYGRLGDDLLLVDGETGETEILGPLQASLRRAVHEILDR